MDKIDASVPRHVHKPHRRDLIIRKETWERSKPSRSAGREACFQKITPGGSNSEWENLHSDSFGLSGSVNFLRFESAGQRWDGRKSCESGDSHGSSDCAQFISTKRNLFSESVEQTGTARPALFADALTTRSFHLNTG